MKKKIIALMLASAMVMGMGLTASAENITAIDEQGTPVEVTSSQNLPTINITVPTSLEIVINPYQMSYTLGDGTSSDQIVCAEEEIVNESNVAIAVNVKELTAKEVKEGITFATAPITSKDTGKSVFLYLEAVKNSDNFASAYNKTSTSQVAVPDATTAGTKVKAAEKASIVILDKGSETATTAKVKVGGSVVANPTKTVTNDDKTKTTLDDPWTSEDTFKISFKFTFTPQVVATTTP